MKTKWTQGRNSRGGEADGQTDGTRVDALVIGSTRRR
jgi:hypothetical protein